MSSRRPLIAGNWKLNKTVNEAAQLVTLIKRRSREFGICEVVVCPPYTALSEVAEALIGTEIGLGAQDLYWEDKGAFTGEVSGPLIRDAGATHVIIGHSERRQFFHETDDTVNKKTRAALKCGLTPIVCVGETLKEREADQTLRVLEKQLKDGLAGFSAGEASRIVIAYEPVWAIGTGKVATPDQAEAAHAFIRSKLSAAFGAETAADIRILYGGSVKPDNIASLAAQADIDGALVGGASLDANDFLEIIVKSGTRSHLKTNMK
ncbi:MAG: triose-phosphate isomerase [Omnitrophica bacterium RIFCSPHIGHO2_02_FULL_63_14]|nr:MAG: triose-phosphate isomerase [Omnitrophica bacterium RIFCSPHIGHO2_02_FULL_63_14]